jgi:hypothetical protein
MSKLLHSLGLILVLFLSQVNAQKASTRYWVEPFAYRNYTDHRLAQAGWKIREGYNEQMATLFLADHVSFQSEKSVSSGIMLEASKSEEEQSGSCLEFYPKGAWQPSCLSFSMQCDTMSSAQLHLSLRYADSSEVRVGLVHSKGTVSFISANQTSEPVSYSDAKNHYRFTLSSGKIEAFLNGNALGVFETNYFGNAPLLALQLVMLSKETGKASILLSQMMMTEEKISEEGAEGLFQSAMTLARSAHENDAPIHYADGTLQWPDSLKVWRVRLYNSKNELLTERSIPLSMKSMPIEKEVKRWEFLVGLKSYDVLRFNSWKE